MRPLITISLIFSLCTWSLSSKAGEPEISKQLHLQTDKQLYVSGENIAFKCTHTLLNTNGNDNNILFVDICGEDYLISSRVLIRENSHWSGKINIPDSVQTGIYLLRAYLGDEHGRLTIVSKPVSVLNRFGNNEVNEHRKLSLTYLPLNQMNIVAENISSAIRTYASKASCPPGDTIRFSVENNLETAVGGVSFSVFKVNDHTPNSTLPPANYEFYRASESIKIFNHLTLSGKVTSLLTNQPAENEMVLLSIPDTIPNIHYNYTNEKGEFRFQLDNYYGLQDAVIQTMSKDRKYKIELYPMQLLPPKSIPFFIPTDVETSEFAKLSVQRATLHKAFETEEIKQFDITVPKYPFYGATNKRTYPGQYIDLDDFKEIAWEILPILKYRIDRDSTYLRIWDPLTKVYFNQPMILVDGIPVFNPADLNVLNSKLIQWIEIQSQERCYGDLSFEGLVAIQTYEGDFTNVKMPMNAIRTKIETFEQHNQKPPMKPLFRDVLHWNPKLDPGMKTHQVDVVCSNEKGNYVAIAQSYDESGNGNRAVFYFVVE